ncbi:hypothetical protein JW887_00510, partial [Candidatus Dojkabacteria bacterium]|nr:hypothetical protein [Candidatus Dojkabacteria bacterium]
MYRLRFGRIALALVLVVLGLSLINTFVGARPLLDDVPVGRCTMQFTPTIVYSNTAQTVTGG